MNEIDIFHIAIQVKKLCVVSVNRFVFLNKQIISYKFPSYDLLEVLKSRLIRGSWKVEKLIKCLNNKDD